MTMLAARSGRSTHDVTTNIRHVGVLIVGASDYMTMEGPVGTPYQVPAGKTFFVTRLTFNYAGGPNWFHVGYGDTAVASGAPAPTNFVKVTQAYGGGGSSIDASIDVMIPIPANKFPCIKNQSGTVGYIKVEGFEQ